MKHSFSVSELLTVCSVHVANDPSQVLSVHYVRDSGVVSVEVLDSQRANLTLRSYFSDYYELCSCWVAILFPNI